MYVYVYFHYLKICLLNKEGVSLLHLNLVSVLQRKVLGNQGTSERPGSATSQTKEVNKENVRSN